jgi:CheY-like chemotaxis protein
MPDRMLKILIVDDDRWLASALKRALCNHRPVVETDSVVAARRLREGEWFDVVVSDYNMPRMTGLELLATAREMRDPPIFVLMSGDDDLEAVGAEAVLQKPFKMSDLILLITAAADRKASAPTTRIQLSSFAA